jgi:hypothetical protein
LAKLARADKTAKRYSIEAANCQERKQPEWKIPKAAHQLFAAPSVIFTRR